MDGGCGVAEDVMNIKIDRVNRANIVKPLFFLKRKVYFARIPSAFLFCVEFEIFYKTKNGRFW